MSKYGLNNSAKGLISDSWRKDSKKTYDVYLRKWNDYCDKNNVDLMKPTDVEVANFLSFLFDQNLSYSACKVARAAVASFIVFDYSKNELLRRIMRGVFQRRPQLTKEVTWDAGQVLRFYKHKFPAKKLSIMDLTIKTVLLLALIMGQRVQGLHLINVLNIEIKYGMIKIVYGDLLKTTRPNFHQGEIVIKGYPADKRLCPVHYVKRYLKVTNKYRKSKSLFLITQKPYGAAAKGTIAKWIRKGLHAAGINMKMFSPHSTRAASTSKMKTSKVPLLTIMKTAGWSSAGTFAKFYQKKITSSGIGMQHLL